MQYDQPVSPTQQDSSEVCFFVFGTEDLSSSEEGKHLYRVLRPWFYGSILPDQPAKPEGFVDIDIPSVTVT